MHISIVHTSAYMNVLVYRLYTYMSAYLCSHTYMHRCIYVHLSKHEYIVWFLNHVYTMIIHTLTYLSASVLLDLHICPSLSLSLSFFSLSLYICVCLFHLYTITRTHYVYAHFLLPFFSPSLSFLSLSSLSLSPLSLSFPLSPLFYLCAYRPL